MNEGELANVYIEEAFKEIDELNKSRILLRAQNRMYVKTIEQLQEVLKQKDEEIQTLTVKKNKSEKSL